MSYFNEIKLTDGYGFDPEYTPMGDMRSITPTRIVGAPFGDSTTIDSNFWSFNTSSVATASLTMNVGEMILNPGTASNGSASMWSVRKARYIGSYPNTYRGIIQLDANASTLVRRWGVAYGATMPVVTDGAWFFTSGSVFGVATMKNSVETQVTASFNGSLGSTYTAPTTCTTWEMYWTNTSVWFVVADQLLHKASFTSAPWSSTMNFFIYNLNSNAATGGTSNSGSHIRVQSIRRLGPEATQPTYNFISGTTTGTTLKYGPGNIQGLVVGSSIANAEIVVWDNTAASGNKLFQVKHVAANVVPYSVNFADVPYFNGLTVQVNTGSIILTTIYE